MQDITQKEHTTAVFDMDGVIIDSGPLHMEAWQIILNTHGIEVPQEKFRKAFGMRDSEVVPHLIGLMADEAIAELMKEKSTMFQQLVSNKAIPVEGIVEYIQALQSENIGTALASLATAEEINTVLETVGLRDMLNIVVTRDNTMRDKPAPDIYLTAAYRLGVDPTTAVVFEDAVSGVEAARKAGTTTVAVTTSHDRGELSHADVVVDDFREPVLIQLFQ